MKLLASLTREALKHRSALIVERLLRSDATLDAAELLGSALGTQSWAAFKDIAAALANANFDREFSVPARDGDQPIVLRRTAEGVVICVGESAGQIIWELSLLDPDASVRTASLDNFAGNARPCLPRETHWRAILRLRPLTPLELNDFVVGALDAAGQKLSELSEAFAKAGNITVEGLVPGGRSYYECLIGSVPAADLSPQEYVTLTLYPHLRGVLDRDPQWGWLCAQAAFVGPSVDLDQVFRGKGDDVVLSVAADFLPLSPLAYVAVLSAAMPRAAGEPAILAMAQDTMAALIDATHKPWKERGAEALFPALVRLTLSRICADEQLSAAPAYWRRLAAFAHANMLLQFLDFSGIDAAEFEKWSSAAQAVLGDVRTYMDALEEPAWLPDADYLFAPWVAATGFAIRICSGSPVGSSIFGDAQRARLDVPSGMAGFAEVFAAAPDLLRGRVRASDQEDPVMNEEHATLLLQEPSTKDRHGTLLVLLLQARLKRFPDELRIRFLEWIQDIPKDESADAKQALEQLCVAARIGAVQPDIEIANATARLVLEVVANSESAELASLAWLCVIFAAGAHADRAVRDSWLEQQLLALALTLPKGASCVDLASRIELMQRFEPATARHFGRARYAAVSAIV